MNALEQSLEISNDDGLATVSFFAIEKQFGHEIRIERDGKKIVLRTDDQIAASWPPAPPLQDIHFEERENGQLLFGVGMAGNTHYSLSIAAEKTTLKFEFAAFVKNEPGFVGTSYRMDQSVDCQLITGLLFPHKNSQPISADQSSFEKNLIIEPIAHDDGSLPRTIQWGFDIRL